MPYFVVIIQGLHSLEVLDISRNEITEIKEGAFSDKCKDVDERTCFLSFFPQIFLMVNGSFCRGVTNTFVVGTYY